MPSVRIIQIAESWGGMEHNNTQLAAHLVRQGATVAITTVGARAYSLMPARYRGLFELEEIDWPLERLPGFRQWYRLMKDRPADVVVLPKNWWAKGGLALVWAARLAYRRVVLREHVAVPNLPRPRPRPRGGIPRPHLWWWRHIAYGRALSLPADRIICVSDVVRSRLMAQCGFPADRTVTIHNGVDTALFCRRPADGAAYRAALGIPESAIVVGAVGRLQIGAKRHDLSLRAFSELVHADPRSELRFLLVGDGPDREKLIDLARQLDVSDRVTVAPFTSEPWQAYSALDVFLMPSAFEAFGLALAEAMACECCVVATAVDGVVEILAEPGIGSAVRADDYQAFRTEVQRVVAMTPGQRGDMGRLARESVRRRFEADVQYRRIIAEVLGPAGRQPVPATQEAPVTTSR